MLGRGNKQMGNLKHTMYSSSDTMEISIEGPQKKSNRVLPYYLDI